MAQSVKPKGIEGKKVIRIAGFSASPHIPIKRNKKLQENPSESYTCPSV